MSKSRAKGGFLGSRRKGAYLTRGKGKRAARRFADQPTWSFHRPQGYKGHAKIGRNDPCPCGSGAKWKKCHGAHGTAVMHQA